MIIPVRCFTCGKVISDKWYAFKELLSRGKSKEAALDELGLKRYCCRTIFITHVDLLEDVMRHKKA
jgi:DNA-directed RNA polymerase subunit N